MQMANIQGGGMVAGSMIVGGISAEIMGGDFWEGAKQAGIIAGFNHAAHYANEEFQQDKKRRTEVKNLGAERRESNVLVEGVGVYSAPN